MKKIIFTLFLLNAFLYCYSQKKYTKSQDLTIDLFSNNWEEGSYLIFRSNEEIKNAYEELNNLINSKEKDISDDCFSQPLLDNWESRFDGFESMRKTYEKNECKLLNEGFDLKSIKDIPIIDDALATLISVDGIVQVGNSIEYFSDDIYAKAPIELKDRLRDILNGNGNFDSRDKKNGIEITFRSNTSCHASFTLEINHVTKEVFVQYTGDPIEGGDKHITWDLEGNDNHKDEDSFMHKYSSLGEKKICVTYTEYDIVPDTTYFSTSYTVDTTITVQLTDTTTTTKDTTIIRYVKHYKVDYVKKLVCTDTYCKSFEIGSCTADFDYEVGIDNVVTFTNKSSVPYGTITGYLWNFGDGHSSTLPNPTHTFECNRDYTVTLKITSNQCEGGYKIVSQKIKAKGLLCCDKNPQSSWKEKINPNDNNKKIKYRYDMGTNWEWLDQDFKGKIKYYEYRYGGVWPFKSIKWRKTKGLLDVDFIGNLYGKDEDGCICQTARELKANPDDYLGKSKTFKDNLGGNNLGTKKTVWMKQTDPVKIEYRVDGVLYLIQTCTTEPGFVCEQSN